MVGYRFAEDLAFSLEQREVMSRHREVREVGGGRGLADGTVQVMNVLTDSEIRDILWAKLTAIPGTVQIIFSNSQCCNCGEKVSVLLSAGPGTEQEVSLSG